jgi:hypothetical protein
MVVVKRTMKVAVSTVESPAAMTKTVGKLGTVASDLARNPFTSVNKIGNRFARTRADA